MQTIEAILFEPVGCLAEFAPDAFDAIALRVFRRPPTRGRSGSDAYWRFVDLVSEGGGLTPEERSVVEQFEREAVSQARGYDDVAPALSELQTMGITTVLASSLS